MGPRLTPHPCRLLTLSTYSVPPLCKPRRACAPAGETDVKVFINKIISKWPWQ